jgi:rfaE bifunctional protein nucleotidyltransferase chain/domain
MSAREFKARPEPVVGRQRGRLSSDRAGHADKPGMNDVSASGQSAQGKIVTLEQLLSIRAAARAKGRAIVQCHGCFDIVHPGHLRHLRHARAQGDMLLVTITGDELINKGTGRPLIPQELRAENLAALDCVDLVYIDPEPTAVRLLERVQPDVYVKGREYELNNDPRFKAEQDAVIRAGGRVVFSSGDVVFSSTALIAALEQSADPYHGRLRQLLGSNELSGEALTQLIGHFRGKRVVVIGEVIQDTYILCDKPDVAGESPVLTLRPIERRMYDGGAAIIARHLAAMGAMPTLVTALDDGPASTQLRHRLLAEGIEVRAIAVDRAMPEKQRFLIGAQKVMKLDLVDRLELDAVQQRGLIELVERTLFYAGRDVSGMGESPAARAMASAAGAQVDACIIADFGLGLLTAGVLPAVCELARRHARIVSADVSGRRSSLLDMLDVDLICPSESELRDATRLFDQGLPMVVHNLLSTTRARRAIVTMGPDGLVAFDRLPGFPVDTPAMSSGATPAGHLDSGWVARLKSEHVPALSAHAIDPLGCGDALMSAATLALASGGSTVVAGFLGAIAAGVEANRLGNTVVSASDLRQGLARIHSSHLAYAPAEVVAGRSGSVAASAAAVRSASDDVISVRPRGVEVPWETESVSQPASGSQQQPVGRLSGGNWSRLMTGVKVRQLASIEAATGGLAGPQQA